MHQLPLTREIVKRVGEENLRYVDAELGGQQLLTVNVKVLHIGRILTRMLAQ